MCWLDRTCSATILKLRDSFGVEALVETGTAEGNSAIFYSRHFEDVYSCEADPDLFALARKRSRHLPNVHLYQRRSPVFLRSFKTWPAIFFLDAHSPGDWPIWEELEALRENRRCIIVIHDFKVPVPGLGYLKDGHLELGLDYIHIPLVQVNPGFHLYHNLAGDIVTLEEAEKGVGVPWDEHTRKVLEYAWSSPARTQRGILYAVPEPVDENELGVKAWTSV